MATAKTLKQFQLYTSDDGRKWEPQRMFVLAPTAAAALKRARPSLGRDPGYVAFRLAKPHTNPANPSDSVLKGAKILGTVRNSRGTVTGLRVQLRPGAKAGGGGAGARSNPPNLRIPLDAMKYSGEREYYPNGVSISAKRISGRSYGYTVHYGGWHTKLFTAPGAARKFAEKMSKG